MRILLFLYATLTCALAQSQAVNINTQTPPTAGYVPTSTGTPSTGGSLVYVWGPAPVNFNIGANATGILTYASGTLTLVNPVNGASGLAQYNGSSNLVAPSGLWELDYNGILKTDSGSFTTSGTGTVTAVKFVGPLTGNVTGTASAASTAPWSGLYGTAPNLSVFSSTTSAQLAGVLSDETGTGFVVYSIAPALTGSATLNGSPILTSSASGTLTLGGSLTGSGSPTGTINATIAASPRFTGTPAIGGTLSYADTNEALTASGSVNGYYQLIMQNLSSGSTASTDIVLSNDLGTATTYYVNLGINSSGFSGTGLLNTPNASYLTATSGSLVVGTTGTNDILFVTNSGTTAALDITASGSLIYNRSITNTAGGLVTQDSNGVIQANTYPTTWELSSIFQNNNAGPLTFISSDATNFNTQLTLGGSFVYTDGISFRDPRILHVGKYYYMAYTNLGITGGATTSNSVGMAVSTDQKNWTKLSTPNWSSFFTGSEAAIWNGGYYYDTASSTQYLMFACVCSLPTIGGHPFIVSMTPNGTSTTFGTPQAMTLGTARNTADFMQVYKSGSTYYGLVQDFGSSGTSATAYVEMFTASALTGTWTLTGTNNWAGWGLSEGGSLITLPNGNLRFFFVPWGGGAIYRSDAPSITGSWSAATIVTPTSTIQNLDWADVIPTNDLQSNEVFSGLQQNNVSGTFTQINPIQGTTTVTVGNQATSGTATPTLIQMDGSFATGTVGTAADLKISLLPQPSGNVGYGIGLSNSLLQFQVFGGFAWYGGNGVAGTPCMTLSKGGDLGMTGSLSLITGGDTLLLKGGSNSLSGTVVLASGTGTVTSSAINSKMVIFTTQTGVSGAASVYSLHTAISGTVITFTGLSTDSGTYNWGAISVNN